MIPDRKPERTPHRQRGRSAPRPSLIRGIWQPMHRSQYFAGGHVLSAAISAIDIALYNIKGTVLGVPVHELLGGRQRAT